MGFFGDFEGYAHGSLFGLRGHPQFTRSLFPVVLHCEGAGFTGLGSCFCVSFEGNCVTAMHVVSDTIKGFDPNGPIPWALGIVCVPGIAYGRVELKPFRIAREFRLFPGKPDPLAFDETMHDISRIELDLGSFTPSFREGDRAIPLWVRTGRRPWVKVGDRLMAVGYDQITGVPSLDNKMLEYSDSLKGCIVGVHQLADRRGRGGPTIVLDVDLPPGFSGGPVLACDGSVVGVVSTGNKAAGYSTIVWTEPLPQEAAIFDGQNHDNKDWFNAWGVYVGDEKSPREIFWRRSLADSAARLFPEAKVARGVRPIFDERSFVRT
jgi:hypothetical protein